MEILKRDEITLMYSLTKAAYTLLVCLSVRLCPMNVKTAEPIGPKCFDATRVTSGKLF